MSTRHIAPKCLNQGSVVQREGAQIGPILGG
jgi:hypothetical protein